MINKLISVLNTVGYFLRLGTGFTLAFIILLVYSYHVALAFAVSWIVCWSVIVLVKPNELRMLTQLIRNTIDRD
jgi:hypothetical protein